MRFGVLLTLAAALTQASAQPGSGELQAVSHVETQPGRPVSLFFRAIGPLRGEARVLLPEGWFPLLPPESLDLGAGQQESLLLLVGVPAQAPAGTYPVTLVVAGKQATARVTVKEVRALKVRVESKPPAASGVYRVVFRVRNDGSRHEVLSLKAQANLSRVVALTPPRLELGPGAEAAVEVTLVAGTIRQEIATDFVRLEVEAQGISASASVAVPLLPEPGSILDRFHTLSGTLEMSYRSSGLSYRLEAKGPTAPERKDQLDLRLGSGEASLAYRFDPLYLGLGWSGTGPWGEASFSPGTWESRLVLKGDFQRLDLIFKDRSFRIGSHLSRKEGSLFLGGVAWGRGVLLEETCPLEGDCLGSGIWVVEAQLEGELDLFGGGASGRASVGLSRQPWRWGLSYSYAPGSTAEGLEFQASHSLQGGGQARFSWGWKPEGTRAAFGLNLPWPQPKEHLEIQALWNGRNLSFLGEWRQPEGTFLRAQGQWGQDPFFYGSLGLTLTGVPGLERGVLALGWRPAQGLNVGISLGGSWTFGVGALTYRLDANPRGLGLEAAYRMPLDLPIYPKPGLAQLRGRVVDPEGRPVPGVYLTLSRLAARTDSEGAFWFPAVPRGEHLLNLLGTGFLSRPQLPLRLSLQEGEERYVEILLQPAGVVRGRVSVVPPERPEPGVIYGIPGLPSARLIQGLLVEARQGERLIQRYTDEFGIFTFGALPPGRWQIRVVFDRFPEAYRLDPQEVEINLASGENYTMDFAVHPLPRSISFEEEESL